MTLEVSKSGPLRVDDVADRSHLTASDLDRQRMLKGFALAWGLIGLIGLVLILIGIYAALTYPSPESAREYLGAAATPTDLRALHDSWFSEVKDLLQLLVVALLVPLLATLVGYIFGHQSASS